MILDPANNLKSLLVGKKLFLPPPEMATLIGLLSEISDPVHGWTLAELLQKCYSLTRKGLVYFE